MPPVTKKSPATKSSTKASSPPLPAKKAPCKQQAAPPWDTEMAKAVKKQPPAKKAAPATKKVAAKKAGKSDLTLRISDMSVPEAKPHLRFPTSLPGCADRYAEVMDQRLQLSKEVEKLAEEEAALKLHIINNLPLSEASGVAGRKASVKVVQKERIVVLDWEKIQDYAVRNRKKGGFAIFQRRVNDATIKELLEKDKKFTGAELTQYKSLSMSRIK